MTQPFISAWYGDRFINWITHTWSPLNPHRQYNIESGYRPQAT